MSTTTTEPGPLADGPDPALAAHPVIAGKRVAMPIASIRPYWRNPRRVPEEAVNALAQSIRDYGYQQPIVVDEDGIIIVGHTRYAAVRKLGYDAVPVLVATNLSPEQVRALRVIDNRVAEFTEWDYDALATELATLDDVLRTTYFPEVVFAGDPDPDGPAIDAGSATPDDWSHVVEEVEFVCPKCFHSWEMTVTKAAILAGSPLTVTPDSTQTEEK
jgi:hypothetical protein